MNYSEVELLSRAHQLFAGDSRRPGLDAGTTPYGDLLSRAADLNVGAGQRRYQLAVDHSRAALLSAARTDAAAGAVITGAQRDRAWARRENRFPYDIEFIIRGESEQHRTKVACFGVNERVVVVLESPLDSIIDKAEADRLRCQVVAATGLQLDELITVRRGAIPTTTSGKLKRRAVAQAYRDGTLPRLATHAWTADPDSAPKTTRSSLEGAH